MVIPLLMPKGERSLILKKALPLSLLSKGIHSYSPLKVPMKKMAPVVRS